LNTNATSGRIGLPSLTASEVSGRGAPEGGVDAGVARAIAPWAARAVEISTRGSFPLSRLGARQAQKQLLRRRHASKRIIGMV
jgi:hypothetical protein